MVSKERNEDGEPLPITPKKPYFRFKSNLYKQTDGVAMVSLSLVYYEEKVRQLPLRLCNYI